MKWYRTLAGLPLVFSIGCSREHSFVKQKCGVPEGEVIVRPWSSSIRSFEIKQDEEDGCRIERYTANIAPDRPEGYELYAHVITWYGDKKMQEQEREYLCRQKPPYPEPETKYVIIGSPRGEELQNQFREVLRLREKQKRTSFVNRERNSDVYYGNGEYVFEDVGQEGNPDIYFDPGRQNLVRIVHHGAAPRQTDHSVMNDLKESVDAGSPEGKEILEKFRLLGRDISQKRFERYWRWPTREVW